MPCYFGVKTNGSKVAWALFGAFFLSAAALMITAKVKLDKASNEYDACPGKPTSDSEHSHNPCWGPYEDKLTGCIGLFIAGILIGVIGCTATLSFMCCCSHRPATNVTHDVEAKVMTAVLVDPKAAVSSSTDGTPVKPWNTSTYPAATPYAAQEYYAQGYPQASHGYPQPLQGYPHQMAAYPQHMASYPVQPGAYQMNMELPRKA